MSKSLAGLLGKSQSQVAKFIDELESLAGYPSHDIRLVNEMQHKLRAKTAALGLDPGDTTTEELSQALLNRFERDNNRMQQLFGSQIDLDKQLEHALTILKQQNLGTVWALKNSVAKDLLRRTPPKHLMKQLNYRSLESMLKREKIAVLYGAVGYVESARWLSSFEKSLASLTAADFESRKIEFVLLPAAIWHETAIRSALTQSLPLAGAVVIWPKDLALRLSPTNLAAVIAQAGDNLKVCSTYLKLHQMQPDFGRYVLRVIQKGLPTAVRFGGNSLSWPDICNYYGQKNSIKPEVFNMHLQDSDFNNQSSIDKLADDNLLLKWWAETKAIARSDIDLTSLNLIDVMQNYLAKLPSGKGHATNFQHHFWQELTGRYLDHLPVENYFLNRLEDKLQPQEAQDMSWEEVNTNSKQPSLAGII